MPSQQQFNGKINPLTQSLFINDVILSLFVSQLNENQINNNNNNINNSANINNANSLFNPNSELNMEQILEGCNESLIYDLLAEQQELQQEEQQTIILETTNETI